VAARDTARAGAVLLALVIGSVGMGWLLWPPAGDGQKNRLKKEKEERPKKAQSSYMFFASEARKQVMEANPTFKMTDISKELGKRWKELSEDKKKKYSAMAEEDKERYSKALKEFEETHPKPPKRPVTPFIAYVKETHDKVKAQNPKHTQTQVLQAIAAKWKTLSPEQKKPYEKISAAAKVKYEKERAAFEQNVEK